MDIASLTLTQARAALAQGDFSPQDLTEACLRQIERLNPTINAFITILRPERSREAAKSTSYPKGKGALAGLPIAVKDLYETAGVRTTAGTKFFADYVPSEDAVAVKKLKEAGAVILGKNNMHEIALGVTNVNATFGNCLNSWDTTRITGGSSGGSAAAVASGMVLAALGTDTGGSIRIPASLCGVVGLKPTYGRISLRGIIPLSWNLDHAGPLTKSARDAALMLQVLAGYDEEDPASADVPVDDYLTHIDEGVQGWRIALAVGEYIEAADSEVLAAIRATAEVFRKLGAQVDEVELPWLREAALANSLMTPADGAAYHRERLQEHPDWFGADIRQRLEMGAAYTSSEYALARRKQAEVRRRGELFFQNYDALLLPSTPISAPHIEGNDALEQARRLTRFTAPFNASGLPALSMPCGFSSTGMPISLQIVGAHWAEAKVLRAAQAYESAEQIKAYWHER
jgi:aspartyl-tRNA(Asn)/glutamyl-tRNA(Gln) amidotransferase subunit A